MRPPPVDRVMNEAATPQPSSLDDLWFLLQRQRGTGEPRIGMALVARGLIDEGLLERALNAQQMSHPRLPLGQMLVDSGVLSGAQLQRALADWLGAIYVDPLKLQAQPVAVSRVPRALAERESVLPLMLRDDTLVVALPDPWDKELIDELRFLTDLKVIAVGAVPGTLPAAVSRAYRPRPMPPPEPAATPPPPSAAPPPPLAPRRDLQSLAAELRSHNVADPVHDPDVMSESDNTLVRLVNQLIGDAIDHGASDIHIETGEPPRPVSIRLRIDGELVPWIELPPQVRYALVARLKVMSDLDISEHRRPQDGKIDFARHGGRPVELRVVIVPTARGLEDVVLRLLNSLEPMPLDRIGLLPRNLQSLREVMHKSYGLILICGPTGCGKTTTLHSVMRELNTEKRKIWTAEDPVEITQQGLRQVQVNPRIGWTFAAAMRTFLRADPDIVMIGEMRDEETARIAVEASLTGHLVMSTLHTNSAAESITRLLEIGLDPFMFSDSLLAVLAQRLVRRLCTNCRVAEPMAASNLEALVHQYVQSAGSSAAVAALDRLELVDAWQQRHAGPDGQLQQWRRVGCAQCEGSGYHGRMGLHELLVVDDNLRSLVRRRASAAELARAGFATGMTTLRQDGVEKVLSGDTDLPEVLAATNQ